MNTGTQQLVAFTVAALGISVLTYFYIQSEAKAVQEVAEKQAKKANASAKKEPAKKEPAVAKPAPVAPVVSSSDACDKVTACVSAYLLIT